MKKRLRNFLKLALVLLPCLTWGESLYSQGRFSASAGWGYYELTNIGIQWNYSEISTLSLYAGYNFGTNDRTSWSAGLSFDQTYRKPLFWKIKAGYSLGAIYWSNDDDLYHFTNISLPVMPLLAYPVSPVLTLRVEGGVIFTAVLESDRSIPNM